MTDRSDDPPAETPMQRALRMRKAALASKPKASDGDALNPKRAARAPTGASRPWMKR